MRVCVGIADGYNWTIQIVLDCCKVNSIESRVHFIFFAYDCANSVEVHLMVLLLVK